MLRDKWCCAVVCPFCGGDECVHLVGWTEDGRTVTTMHDNVVVDGFDRLVTPVDRIVTTGVSARVYRPDDRPIPPGALDDRGPEPNPYARRDDDGWSEQDQLDLESQCAE